jgi:hypothetical protein
MYPGRGRTSFGKLDGYPRHRGHAYPGTTPALWHYRPDQAGLLESLNILVCQPTIVLDLFGIAGQ